MLNQIKAPPEVHIFGLFDFFRVKAKHVFAMANNACVIEQGINASVLFNDFGNNILTLFVISDIQLIRGHIGTLSGELRYFAIELFFFDIRCGNSPTFLDILLDSGKANSLCGTCNNDNFLFTHSEIPF